MKRGALAWLSAGAIAALVVAQWLLATWLAWASGVSDQPAPSLTFDWPVAAALVAPRDRPPHGPRRELASPALRPHLPRNWTSTLGLAFASLFVLWLLYAITDQRTVRGVPPSMEDWTVNLIQRMT